MDTLERPKVRSSFSTKIPHLQLYLDSTSLRTFLECPKKYYYSIILGRVPIAESVHLTFGILVHKGLEIYHKARHSGKYHEDALRTTVQWALEATWIRALNRPWTPNDDKVGRTKNRYTLLRTIIWYLDEYQDDPMATAIIEGGQPAVELPFMLDSGHTASTGEEFVLCGFLDRIAVQQGRFFVTDVKTTGRPVDLHYFNRFSPDTQMTLYTLAGQSVFKIPVEGVMVDGIQVQVENNNFARQLTPRSPEQLVEWQEQLVYWLMQLNQCATSNVWPRNDAACELYGGCPYRSVCAKPTQSEAEQHLNTYYQERSWDPLLRRTDT